MANRFRLTIYITLPRLIELLAPYKGKIDNNEAIMFIRQFNSLVAENFVWEMMLEGSHVLEKENPHINGLGNIIDEYFNMHRPEEQHPAILAQQIRSLRLMIAIQQSKGLLYLDDGEISDCSERPAIDYRRDSYSTIKSKLTQRAKARLLQE